MPLSRVLLIDDDEIFRVAMAKALKRKGVGVIQASNGAEGITLLSQKSESSPQAAVLDLRMPGVDGMEVLERTPGRQIPVIVLTGHGTIPDAVKAMRLGAYSFLLKPVDAEQLYEVLLQATGAAGQVTAQLIGESPATQRLRAMLNQLAPADDPVLLFGETGTGKEVAANYLHAHSTRVHRPFVGINLGGLPGELIESELFGYGRGAFTGAERRKPGLFAVAEDGTLFLDEISELPIEHQVKLLRVLETRRYRPLGEAREEQLRARLVVATNRNLAALVRAGAFREDLFYRLNVLPIELPPLRARREDIVPIAIHWLEKILRRPVRFLPEAEGILTLYDYPGNVRELVNVVRRIALFVTDDCVDAALVKRMMAEDPFRSAEPVQRPVVGVGQVAAPPGRSGWSSTVASAPGVSSFQGAVGADATSAGTVGTNTVGSNTAGSSSLGASALAAHGGAGAGPEADALSLRALEKLHIEKLLKEHRNVTQVARILGIDRRTLQRKMKSLEMEYDGRESPV
ncbi:MAG: sigma-54-dependent transcriptional regulator [Myxococcota bacterium]